MSLQHSLLIASPLLDPHPLYTRSLVFVLQSTRMGHTGILINKYSFMTVKHLLKQMGLDPNSYQGSQKTLLFGGLDHKGSLYLLHYYQQTYQFHPTKLTSLIHTPPSPKHALIIQGLTQWPPGQLEQEIHQGLWLTDHLQDSLLFKTPVARRYNKALANLSIRLPFYQREVGHG